MKHLLTLIALLSCLPLYAQFGRGRDSAPKPGTVAPDFDLKTMDNKKSVKLSDFKGKKPVVLIFGSIT